MFKEDHFFQELTITRQKLHQIPELSGKEYLTTQFIKNYLETQGIRILDTQLETGLVAEIGLNSGPIIGLRADIDALPVQEETQVAYQSQHKDVMHACGHDFHTASLLGAAKLLKEREQELPGTIRLIFQPAEENFQGAKAVIETVAFDDWDALVGFHNSPTLPLGTIGHGEAKQTASVDRFFVTVHGTGTHAAHPEQGSDPIVTGAQMITNLQAIISRHIPASEEAILSVTHVKAGQTWNVIPEQFVFEGTIRTFDAQIRQQVHLLLERIVHNTADSYLQTANVEWIIGPGSVENNVTLQQTLTPSLTKVAREVLTLSPSLGGEDFAYYQEHVPTYFAWIGTGTQIPLHHPAFSVDDQALYYAVNYYLNAVETLLL